MSTFLSFEIDSVEQPAATDPLEKLTWSALKVRVGDRYVTQAWDKALETERTALYVPAFSIAEWVVRNWWFLFHESCRWESVPKSIRRPEEFEWASRHCLRSADSALLLPKLFLYHDGRTLRVEWRPDEKGSLPDMPAEFIGFGGDQLDSFQTQEALGQFTRSVLARVAHVEDPRVKELNESWRAIEGADREEREFCTLAARMGIDPYDGEEMSDSLASFFEEIASEDRLPLALDLAEVSRPGTIRERWSWIQETTRDFVLGGGTWIGPIDYSFDRRYPADYGYELARRFRKSLDDDLGPLPSVEDAASQVFKRNFRVEDRNHLPGRDIQGIVGTNTLGDIIAAGPRASRVTSQRFQAARSLFHALIGRESCPRLVTRAFSWDQKASRAFAAELLAPQWALIERLGPEVADNVFVETIASDYQVSTEVIKRQLENAGVAVAVE